MLKHRWKNQFIGEGANGGCFVEIESTQKEGIAHLRVGWSCVMVHDAEIPITWLSEVIAIAKAHPEGIAGYLAEYGDGDSYALMCDPA